MKIIKIVSVVLVFAIITGVLAFVLSHRNMSANQSHKFFASLLAKKMGGELTPDMTDEGNLLLTKVSSEVSDIDYQPHLYEIKQPSRVFSTWYVVSLLESKGKSKQVKDLRQDLNRFLAKK